jgi:L-rhamnose mutarotase
MKISTQTGSIARKIGDEKAIVKLAKAGFDAMDYSLYIHDTETGVYTGKDFDKYAKKIKTVASSGVVSIWVMSKSRISQPKDSMPLNMYVNSERLFSS